MCFLFVSNPIEPYMDAYIVQRYQIDCLLALEPFKQSMYWQILNCKITNEIYERKRDKSMDDDDEREQTN